MGGDRHAGEPGGVLLSPSTRTRPGLVEAAYAAPCSTGLLGLLWDNRSVPDPKIPQYHELMWPALTALGGSATVKEMYEHVVEGQHFSEEQQAVATKDGRMSEIEYRLHWARTHLKLSPDPPIRMARSPSWL